MYYSQHLAELRKRIVSSLYFFCCAFAICYYFAEQITLFILAPARLSLHNIPLVFTQLPEGFMAHLKASFWIALLLTFPFIIYQAWLFISPALYKQERVIVMRLTLFSSVIFLFGVGVGYAVITPFLSAISFKIADGWLTPMPRLQNYLMFTVKTAFLSGILLQLPLSMALAVQYDLIALEQYKTKRKVVYAVLLVVAMTVYTSDMLIQIILACGLIAVYELGIFCSALIKHATSPEQPKKD